MGRPKQQAHRFNKEMLKKLQHKEQKMTDGEIDAHSPSGGTPAASQCL